MRERRHFGAILYMGIVLAVAVLNVLAWNSAAFCDAYIAYVFPVWVNTYGRVTGSLPFSLGEWLIVAGVILIVLALIMLPMLIVSFLRRWEKGKRLARRFYLFFAWVLAAVALIMTLNCLILYHASAFSEKYFGADDGEYTLEELLSLRNHVVEQCNRLSRQVARDSDGNVIYETLPGAAGTEWDMKNEARRTMKRLGESYDRLDGWYPRPKQMFFSDFMCQQYMQGYYFPFSMEANYNDVMELMRKPSTMCHELAHLRGYIYEDEANFISYLACTRSDDLYFRYSGYLSVLNYLDNDLYRASKANREAYDQAVRKIRPLMVLGQVRKDNIFVAQEEWDRINGKALIDTEIVDKAADTFIDTTLKVNGVSDGMISYSRVVTLLMQYNRYVKNQEK